MSSRTDAPVSTLRYCERLWQRVLKREHGGQIVAAPAATLESAATTLGVLARMFGEERAAELSPEQALDLPALIDHMATQLAEDVAPYVGGQPFVLRFLPTAEGNAHCTQQTEFGQPLDRPLVVLHQGLLFASLRLSDCIVLENLEGELAHLQRDARTSFQQAAQAYRARDMQGLLRVAVSDDPRAEAELAGYGGAIAARLWMFIAWHELGHVRNGDLQRLAVEAGTVADAERGARSREQERLADAFATRALLRSSSSPGAAWRNAAPVYLFFRWLQVLYDSEPALEDETHPAPAERAALLREQLLAGAPDGEPEHFDWIDARLPHWSSTPVRLRLDEHPRPDEHPHA